jgi:branched-chain amino acid transport system substrate-binding protein
MRRRHVTLGVVLAVGALVWTVTGAAGASAAGKKATGKPVEFGLYNLEDSPFGSFTEFRLGMEAAIKYLNAERDGLHGRPIDLNACAVHGSPETTLSCATKLISAKPAAIFGGFDFFSTSAIPTYEQSGIPVLGGTAIFVEEQRMKTAVRFTGWVLSEHPAEAKYIAKNLKAKTVAVVAFPDLPGGRVAFENDIKPVLEKYGVKKAVLIPGNLAATDVTPAMAAANEINPDAIIYISIPTQCVSAMQAHQSLGIKAKLFLTDTCDSPEILARAGAAAEGVYFGHQGYAANSNDANQEDVKLFRKVMRKYGDPKTPITGVTQDGFRQVMNVWEVLNAAPATTLDSGEAILAAFQATKNQHNFMAHQYSCSIEQVKDSPAVCDAHALLYVVKNGKLVRVHKGFLDGYQDIIPPP